MACIASLSGLPTPFNLLPGQTVTYTVSVTIPSIPACNCASNINTITATASTGFVVSLASLPALPLAGYCGTPFTIDVSITALPTVVPGMNGVVTIEFDHGSTPLQYGYIGVNVVGITNIGEQVINLGEICPDSLVNIPICNLSSEAETFTLTSCGCPYFNLDCGGGEEEFECITQLDLDACECGDFVIQLAQKQEGDYNCEFIVTTGTGYSQRIRVIFTIVPCDFTVTSWELKDVNDHVVVDDTNFDLNCDVFQLGAIGEKKKFQRVLALSSPVQLNQPFYFASWQFAPLPQWGFQFPGKPAQGWHCVVCDVAIDGVYPMEWYGSQHCFENGSATLTISNSGLTVTIDYEFYLMADLLSEPDGIFVENHDYLLRSSLANPNELQNDVDNSVYKTERYFMTALTTEIPSSGTWQKDEFKMKCNLVWYGENIITPAVILSDVTHEFTIPSSSQSTDYVSSIRNTDLRIEFDYVCSDPAGTVPTDAWLVAFRTDTRNNLLNPEENYVIANADLTNSIADGIITAIVTPPTYISGNRFYAEVTIDDCPAGSTPDLATLASYRFILLTHTSNTTEMAVRTQISREVLSINYDDLDFTFTGLVRTLNLADQKYSTNALIVPVNAQTEIEIGVPLPALDTEISAKTGGEITDALSALRAVYLSVYYLAGNVRVQLFNPFMTRRDGFWINDSEQRNNEALVNRSIPRFMNFVFPFTMPDNVLRQATRANYQSDTDRNALNSLGAVLDCQAGILQPIEAINALSAPNNPNLNGIIYIREINQVWVCDSANDLVVRVDALTNSLLPSIALTAGDIPVSLIQVGSKVFVSCSGGSNCRVINIYNQSITNVTGITGVGLSRFALTNSGRLFCTCSTSDEVIEINPSTEAQVGLAIAVGTLPIDIVYNPDLNQLFVGCFSSFDVYRIDMTPVVVGAPISLSGNPFRLCNSKNNGVPKVLAVVANAIDEINLTSFAVTNHVISTGQLGSIFYSEPENIIYLLCNADDNLCLLDANNYSEIAEYPSGDAPRDIVVMDNYIYTTTANDDKIIPYLLPPCPEVPNYSAALRNIYAEWRFQFQMLGNEENYYYEVGFPRVRERIAEPIDSIKFEEWNDSTDTWDVIPNPCPDTGRMRIEVDFTNSQTFLGIAVEQQPVRNNRLTEKSLPSTNIIPVDSEYISAITTTADKIQFEFDYPNWIANGAEKSPGEAYQDYEFYIHILAK